MKSYWVDFYKKSVLGVGDVHFISPPNLMCQQIEDRLFLHRPKTPTGKGTSPSPFYFCFYFFLLFRRLRGRVASGCGVYRRTDIYR